MAGHAQLKSVMTECSKTQIRLTGLISFYCTIFYSDFFILLVESLLFSIIYGIAARLLKGTALTNLTLPLKGHLLWCSVIYYLTIQVTLPGTDLKGSLT